MGYATLHVLGALAVSFAFGVFVLFIGAWEQERIKKRRLQDMAIALGVPITSLESEELVPRLVQYSSHRYSGELLRNRLADFSGMIRTAWGVIGAFVQFVAIAFVGWQMYESGAEFAMAMWSVPALALFIWVMSVAFSLACLLFTGRYPGEPREARKSLAAFIDAQGDFAIPPTAPGASLHRGTDGMREGWE